MLNSYLSTISLHLPLLCLHLYLAVWHIVQVMPGLCGEFFADFCNSGCHSGLEVTRGYGEHGRNFWCNMGGTQQVGVFLHPPFLNSTQLCEFAIFPALFIMVHVMDFLAAPIVSPVLRPLSVFPIIIWRGGLLAPDVWCSIYPLAPSTPSYPLPIPTIITLYIST